jgi:hypothetical protein
MPFWLSKYQFCDDRENQISYDSEIHEQQWPPNFDGGKAVPIKLLFQNRKDLIKFEEVM